MINIRKTTSADPCQAFNASGVAVTSSLTYIGGLDGTFEVELNITQGDASRFQIRLLDESMAILSNAIFSFGDDISTDAPILESGFVAEVQPHISNFIVQSGVSSFLFSKRLWAEANDYTFDSRTDLTISVKLIHGFCSTENSDLVLDKKAIEGYASNPAELVIGFSSEWVYIADQDEVFRYKINGADVGKTELVFNGANGDDYNLIRGLGLLENLTTDGSEYKLIVFARQTSSSSKAVIVLDYDGNAWTVVEIIQTGNNSVNQGLGTSPSRKINGEVVVFNYNDVHHWDGTEWQRSFYANLVPNTSSILLVGDGTNDRMYFNSVISHYVKRRDFTGSTDADYIDAGTGVSDDWTVSVDSAGSTSNGTGGAIGLTGQNILFDFVQSICLIGYDGVVGATSGTLAMLAVADFDQGGRIQFFQEQNGSTDLIKIGMNAFVDLVIGSRVTNIRLDISTNRLYFVKNLTVGAPGTGRYILNFVDLNDNTLSVVSTCINSIDSPSKYCSLF